MPYPLPSDDPLGTDLKIDQNGDLILSTTASNGLVCISGTENVSQAMVMNLVTLPSTYLWGSNVGTPLAQYLDQPLTDADKQDIQNIVADQLVKDSRILQANVVEIDASQPNLLFLNVEADVVVGGTVPISIVIGG